MIGSKSKELFGGGGGSNFTRSQLRIVPSVLQASAPFDFVLREQNPISMQFYRTSCEVGGTESFEGELLTNGKFSNHAILRESIICTILKNPIHPY